MVCNTNTVHQEQRMFAKITHWTGREELFVAPLFYCAVMIVHQPSVRDEDDPPYVGHLTCPWHFRLFPFPVATTYLGVCVTNMFGNGVHVIATPTTTAVCECVCSVYWSAYFTHTHMCFEHLWILRSISNLMRQQMCTTNTSMTTDQVLCECVHLNSDSPDQTDLAELKMNEIKGKRISYIWGETDLWIVDYYLYNYWRWEGKNEAVSIERMIYICDKVIQRN